MFLRDVLVLCIISSLCVKDALSQNPQSIRIPSDGDSCNVVNLNFGGGGSSGGGGEEKVGPKGDKGPRGPGGGRGPKGDKGSKGAVGPSGPAAEVSASEVAAAVLQAMGSTSCSDLMELHGITSTGYYLMRSEKTEYPTYKYCDFEIREGISTCYQLREFMGEKMVYGDYLINDVFTKKPAIVYCGKPEMPTGCEEVNKFEAKISNKTGGVFNIYPQWVDENPVLEVYCDLETDDGGWTVFQRRMDGSVNFTRGWDDYVNGFGNTAGEYWLGLENMHKITNDGRYELRVELTDWYDLTRYIKYENFSIASAEDKYSLEIPYSDSGGNVGNSLFDNIGRPFSTIDNDNDGSDRISCAEERKGGWWYDYCGFSNLNGAYVRGVGKDKTAIWWWSFTSGWYNLKSTEMKFRRME